jgi:hypothetical protein
LWVIFALLDPDPYSNYGSGSNGPIEYGSETLLIGEIFSFARGLQGIERIWFDSVARLGRRMVFFLVPMISTCLRGA